MNAATIIAAWRELAGVEINGYDWLAVGCPDVLPHALIVFEGDMSLNASQWMRVRTCGARVICTGTLNVDLSTHG